MSAGGRCSRLCRVLACLGFGDQRCGQRLGCAGASWSATQRLGMKCRFLRRRIQEALHLRMGGCCSFL